MEKIQELTEKIYREGVEKIKERETYISPEELEVFVEYAVEKIIKTVNAILQVWSSGYCG